MKDLEKAFENIYSNNLWGSPDSIPERLNQKFYSGGGTDPENDFNNLYKNLIQSYVDRDDVKTVAEIGCGDWEVSSRIDWKKVQYTGYDVVKDLIDYNNSNYANDNINFVCDSNIFENNNLKADLIIIKDVLQHLPPSYYINFLKSITSNFKYNIITNDYSPQNSEISFGGYQGNDFTTSPFNLQQSLHFVWNQKFIEAGRKITLTII